MAKLFSIFLLNLLFGLIHSEIVIDNTNSKYKLDGKCNNDLPNLSVGDFNITNGNYA